MKRQACFVGLLFFLIGCQKSPDHKPVPQSVAEMVGGRLVLSEMVVGRPPRITSVLAPLELTFNEPVAPPHSVGTVLDKSPFVLTPAVAGTAQWINQTTIRFNPEKPLAAGASYKVVFNGKTAFGSRREVDDYGFDFKTAEQEVVEFQADFLPDTAGQNMVRFSGSAVFAQPVDLNQISRDLKGVLGGKKTELYVTAAADNRARVMIVSEPIRRGAKGQMLTFSLPASYTVDKGKWVKEVLLPAANEFKVITHMDLTEPGSEQSVYGFRFSDPIRTATDLSGYVRVEPEVPFTVSVDKKFLKLRGSFVPGRQYTVTISEGFPSAFNTRSSGQYTAAFTLNNLKPEVQWLSRGIFLPSSGSYKLQFKSVNVARVQATVTEIFESNLGFFIQSNMLQDARPNRSSGYDDEEYYYYEEGPASFSDLNRVGKEIHKTELSITSEKNRWIRGEIDLGPVFKGKKNTAFVVRLAFTSNDLCGICSNTDSEISARDLYYEETSYYTNPCRDGYYYRNGTSSKLLIACDVGLTVKSIRDGFAVYATNVVTSRPASGIALTLFSYQNQPIQQITTDADGRALFNRTENGYYIRGEHGAGLALIRLDQPSWETSSFDVGGVDEGQGGVNVFIYTDRGVHRPGDTVHLSAIIRSDRKTPPADQQVALKVYNPKQQTVLEEKQRCGTNGHVYFAVPTGISDPTGAWSAELTFADQKFIHPLKIEMVKPNRLKVEMDVPDTLEPGKSSIRGVLQSRYLFGTPAAGLRARLKIDLFAKSLSIPAHSDYTFSHPMRRFDRRDDEIFDANLDDNGTRAIQYQLSGAMNAPELITAVLRTEVYEKGGGFTSGGKRVTVVPYRGFVGVKNPFGWRGAQTGQTYSIPIVATDVSGRLLPGQKLSIKCYVNRRYWWWDSDSRSRADFRTLETTYKIGEFTLISEDRPVRQRLEIDDEGQHFIEVTNEQTGHSAGFFFWASSWGGAAPDQGKPDPVFLSITTDKNTYYTGEKAEISCETPQQGMVIFSLEQGDRILRQEVKPAGSGRTVFSVDINESMVPNCYAVISLIQSHGQAANDLPLRLYGIKPLTVEDYATRLQMTLQAPDEIAPNAKFQVAVSSKAPRQATYTIAVVDEGLLDLTGFDTPDPWNHFFRKIRLGVLTRDNLDEILGRLFPDIDKRFSIGGDLEAERKKRAGESRVQRFKPVVLHQKPMSIKPGETQRTEFTMPNYVGSVRVMVVGSAGHSYASMEKTIPVKQPLMILTTIPRVGRPGDVFSVPVSVFAMDSEIRDVDLSISVKGALRIDGPASARVSFDKPGEKDLAFSVGVRDEIGSGTITITARSGRHQTSDVVELPVTAHNPFFIKASDTTVVKGKPVTLIPRKTGLEGTNAARISFTRFPDIQVHKRFKDLIHYPYGCLEQTTSAAFPQLYIGNVVELSAPQRQMVTDNVNAAISRLSRFQMSGGFSFWPLSHGYSPSVSEWGTSYVGHFLLEAKAAGYHVPDPLLNHWINSTSAKAKDVDRTNHRYQTYRLFLLAMAGKANQGAMNLVRENYLRELDPLSRRMLAASYYLSGQKDAARQIDKTVTTEITSYREMAGTYGSSLRDQAMMSYLSYRMEDHQAAARTLASTAKQFRPYGWYSTQDLAFALLAVSTVYTASANSGGAVPFTLATQGGKTEKMTVKGYQMSIDVSDRWDKELTVSTDGDNPLFVTLFEEGIPIDDRVTTASNGLELTRNFYDDNGRPITIDAIRQGDVFWVRYRVRSLTHERLTELALSSLIPSGWEMINSRLEGTEAPEWVRNFSPTGGTYMDMRDDRVNWFFDLHGSGEANFLVKCNATFKGSYRLPPVVVEPMYSPDYYARIAGGNAVVR